jgi:ribulose-5-phosphate 4-epimerase/fuculose-1-phosphate aldolase
MADITLNTLIDDLVSANHILVAQGVLDGFGHVSVRHPTQAGRFLIARSMAPALVTAADIVECDLEGVVHDTQGRASYVERFIHSEIYAVRPDVGSVIHSHSPAVIPFGVMGKGGPVLRPICHMSGFLGAAVPVFEIRHAAEQSTDLLIRSRALGNSLAHILGAASVALMRGHGNVVVGHSVKQSVFRAIYTETNARLQMQAIALAAGGEVQYLSSGEAREASDMNDQHLDRPWQMWKRDVAN